MPKFLKARYRLMAFITVSVFLGPTHAGTIYTDEASFAAALVGYSLNWYEDFQSLSGDLTGEPPHLQVDPTLLIGDHSVEIFGGDQAYILESTIQKVDNDVTWSNGGVGGGQIRGPGHSSLGLAAMKIEYRNSKEVDILFKREDGETDQHLNEPEFFEINDAADPDKFIGWIAGPGELLSSLTFSMSTDAGSLMHVDNIRGYSEVSEVPVPAAVWLFGSGLLGLVGMARRKKA